MSDFGSAIQQLGSVDKVNDRYRIVASRLITAGLRLEPDADHTAMARDMAEALGLVPTVSKATRGRENGLGTLSRPPRD